MALDSLANISDDKVQPYGGESAFSQTEHNIVAAYLITAGKMETTTQCHLWKCDWSAWFFTAVAVLLNHANGRSH